MNNEFENVFNKHKKLVLEHLMKEISPEGVKSNIWKNRGKIDDLLGEKVRTSFPNPPLVKITDKLSQEFIRKYLENLQLWVNDNISKFGVIFDTKQGDILKGKVIVQRLIEKEHVFSGITLLFDKDYSDVDEAIADHAETKLITKYVWIAPEHIARYVLGDDLAERVAVGD